MNKQVNQVQTFMQTFGQQVPTTPCIPVKEITDLRIALSQEELNEYSQAVVDNDLVLVADALTDRLYVLLGDFISHGMGGLLEPLFDEVQASNMSKLTKDGRVLRREDGKVLKSDQFFSPDLKTIIDDYTTPNSNIAGATEKAIILKSAFRETMSSGGRSPMGIDVHELRRLLDSGYISFSEYLYAIKP